MKAAQLATQLTVHEMGKTNAPPKKTSGGGYPFNAHLLREWSTMRLPMPP